jgi:hypothetical protein
VQNTLALTLLATLAALALSALTTLLAALATLTALTAALVLLSTLLTTLILLARLLFVGVHICSFNFLPGVTTSALKRSSSKPSPGIGKCIQTRQCNVAAA